MRKMRLQTMIEAALMAAMAMVLDFLPSIHLTAAISISFAMVPVFIVAFRWGWKAGMFSGFLWGVLQIIVGDAFILTPVQGFIEYIIAFAFVGFAGFLVYKIQEQLRSGHRRKAMVTISLAIFIGSFARYFFHFIAGVFFFARYAPPGMSPVWYSFVVNGITMVLTFILCAIVTIALISVSPRLIMKGQGGQKDR